MRDAQWYDLDLDTRSRSLWPWPWRSRSLWPWPWPLQGPESCKINKIHSLSPLPKFAQSKDSW